MRTMTMHATAQFSSHRHPLGVGRCMEFCDIGMHCAISILRMREAGWVLRTPKQESEVDPAASTLSAARQTT